MRTLFLVVILLCFAFFPLAADDDHNGVNIDDLFELPAESEEQDTTEQEAQAPPEAAESNDVLSTLLDDDRFFFKGQYNFSFGYSPELAFDDFSDLVIYDAGATVSLDTRINSRFRVFQSYRIEHPDYLFDIPELFGDYTLGNLLFMRFGIQKISWGISSIFPFTNLPARLSDDFNDSRDDFSERSFSLKVDYPLGTGGVELLALTRNGFLDDPEHPQTSEVGFGGKINIANRLFDLTVGDFYHGEMHNRAFYSLKTTLFDRIELYQEGLWAHATDGEKTTALIAGKEKIDNVDDLSANIGLYIDFFDERLQLQGEYFFNGEESELELVDVTYPLYYGHNYALNLGFKASPSTSLFLQGRYNQYTDSMLLIPGARIKLYPELQCYVAAPLVFGPKTGGYYVDNPDANDRRAFLVLAVRLSGTVKRNW
ncbi:hypothetical protein [Sediminispirochaeta smaragdinae]|uniref:Phosphate-selective porin O and P n=1 Tax=Sediminispirochaeta smaragdinae (strain DSM 11293 / JCM 15392 / SEBR 4228) TaxID=573413 RepID=E1RBW7_SEDSS|nr:hypothetical protein [Sediminispirochaeta smaragdinae]ADK79847.1 hypothetical protein Spirs_0712 [Sediminispirochaeta smaragdinae DSM 11293]